MSDWSVLEAELDQWAAAGRKAPLWLRDDDAVSDTPALRRLLALTEDANLPLVLAVIPAHAHEGLVSRLSVCKHVRVAVHGYAHANHAPVGQKKMELGPHRPTPVVLAELRLALSMMERMFQGHLMTMLVPPWNRMAPDLIEELPELGFRSLSMFGPWNGESSSIRVVNCHLDPIDWRGTRGCRPVSALLSELTEFLAERRLSGGGPVGILTHHLVHDEPCWDFLGKLIGLTTRHPGAAWQGPCASAG